MTGRNARVRAAVVAVAGLLFVGAGAQAGTIKPPKRAPSSTATITPTIVDLTQVTDGNPDSGEANGAKFFTNNQRPTGTGVIEPFLRLQHPGVAQGFNTDTNNVLDNKDGKWTHSLQLADVPVVQLDGKNYLEFLLDINENNGHDNELVSLNKIELYLAHTGDIDELATLRGEKQVFDLDSSGEVTIELKYNPDHGVGTGSGSGDMYAYIPLWADYSTASGPQFLYLYSLFGTPNGVSAGFEEWAFVGQPTLIPLPASTWSGIAILAVLGGVKLRRYYRSL